MSFTAIDLSKLPPPDVVEGLSVEAILEDMVSRYSEALPELADNIQYESDPVRKLLELVAYEKTRLLNRVNSAAKAVMLAFAQGSDLDNLAALAPVSRHEGEDDEAFRARVQLGPEGFSVAGPRGAYEFHTRSVSKSITDVYVDVFDLDYKSSHPDAAQLQSQIFELINQFAKLTDQPPLGHVDIYAFENAQNPLSPEIAAQLSARLGGNTIRPTTDYVSVKPPLMTPYEVEAEIIVQEGPDAQIVRRAAIDALQAYIASAHKFGGYVTRANITAALVVSGVLNVRLNKPLADIEPMPRAVPVCTDINIILGQA